MTVGSVGDVLKTDKFLANYWKGRSAYDAAVNLTRTGSDADPNFVAAFTTSRLRSLEIEVRAKAKANRNEFVSPKQISGALSGNGKAAHLSSVVGAAYNAQAGSNIDARGAARGQVIMALLKGDFSNTTPAVANNSGNPNLYKNQYTDSFCGAAGQIKGALSC